MMTRISAPRMEQIEARQIVGIARSYQMDTRDQIAALWQDLFAAPFTVENAVAGGMYGLSFDWDGQGGFRYGCGVQASPVAGRPDNSCVMEVSQGLYAVFSGDQPLAAMPGLIDAIYRDWLPGSGYVVRPGALVEFYGPEFDPATGGWDIWVPVQKSETA